MIIKAFNKVKMNIFEARKILGVGPDTDDENIKKQYKKLAMQYHPDKSDKSDSNEKFSKINEAYKILTHKKEHEPFGDGTDILKGFMNSFMNNFKEPIFTYHTANHNNQLHEIFITPLEYLKGTVKEVYVLDKELCNCDAKLCGYCSGSGFSLVNQYIMTPCIECMGEGWVKGCHRCNEGLIEISTKKNIHIPSCVKLNSNLVIDNVYINIKLHESGYFYNSGLLCYKMNISLGESILGIRKKFVDPYNKTHKINIQQSLNNNDGYRIVLENNVKMLLVFHVVIPKEISDLSRKKIMDIPELFTI